MNRFSPKKHFEIHGICFYYFFDLFLCNKWFLAHLSSLLFVFLFCVFIVKGIYNIDHSTLQEQANSLEKAIRRSVVQCYVVEGTYPPSLDYLVEHYGITYDSDQYYVDYTSIGSNLMPDITIIPLNQE